MRETRPDKNLGRLAGRFILQHPQRRATPPSTQPTPPGGETGGKRGEAFVLAPLIRCVELRDGGRSGQDQAQSRALEVATETGPRLARMLGVIWWCKHRRYHAWWSGCWHALHPSHDTVAGVIRMMTPIMPLKDFPTGSARESIADV
jgi:hypothetical protein